MKKYPVIILVLFSLISCDKEDTFCYECTTISRTSSGGQSSSATSKTTHCDITPEEANKIEQQGTNVTTSSASGSTVTINTTTTCMKKQ